MGRAGFAFTRGLPDAVGALPRDAMLAHVHDIAAATPLPVNADFQSGFGAEPEDVAESVTLCVRAGAAGLSIEDATGDAARPLYDAGQAVERLRAARCAIDATGPGLTVARLAELGVRRISVGSALARVAWGGFMRAARSIAETGGFDALAGGAPFAELEALFAAAGGVSRAGRRTQDASVLA